MKLAIGSDHAGYLLKSKIIDNFSDIDFIDCGAFSEESTDYPDWISKVGYEIKNNRVEMGIVICGSGIGASIVANKIKGIRAALCFNSLMAELSRKHNNANILALGARIIGHELAFNIVKAWLGSSFEGGRHLRRIEKIERIEGEAER